LNSEALNSIFSRVFFNSRIDVAVEIKYGGHPAPKKPRMVAQHPWR